MNVFKVSASLGKSHFRLSSSLCAGMRIVTMRASPEDEVLACILIHIIRRKMLMLDAEPSSIINSGTCL